MLSVADTIRPGFLYAIERIQERTKWQGIQPNRDWVLSVSDALDMCDENSPGYIACRVQAAMTGMPTKVVADVLDELFALMCRHYA